MLAADATDLAGLLATWTAARSSQVWHRARARAESDGDASAVRAADRALAELPDVTPLDALRANAELVSRLTTDRWMAMQAAREQGASWEQIGQALGVSRQSAWEFLQRKTAEHQQPNR
jgi:Homeodomain-like domain